MAYRINQKTMPISVPPTKPFKSMENNDHDKQKQLWQGKIKKKRKKMIVQAGAIEHDSFTS